MKQQAFSILNTIASVPFHIIYHRLKQAAFYLFCFYIANVEFIRSLVILYMLLSTNPAKAKQTIYLSLTQCFNFSTLTVAFIPKLLNA